MWKVEVERRHSKAPRDRRDCCDRPCAMPISFKDSRSVGGLFGQVTHFRVTSTRNVDSKLQLIVYDREQRAWP